MAATITSRGKAIAVRSRSAVLTLLSLCCACPGAVNEPAPPEDPRMDGGADPRKDPITASPQADAGAQTGDAGRADTGAPDAGPLDAGPLDANPLDANPLDASPLDAGPVDASPADASPPGPRSVLFPSGWLPLHAGGLADAAGRALPDFGYAGYHMGIEPPPHGAGVVVATVSAALGDGLTDATAGIQAAISSACSAGGGVVQIPAGTFRLTFPAPTGGALEVRCRAVVLRGEGPARTHLWLDDPTQARGRAMISFRGAGALFDAPTTTTYPLTADAPGPTTRLDVASGGGLAVGDHVAIRSDNTPDFREDHRMDPVSSGLANLWPSTGFQGITYARRIVGMGAGHIQLDAPTHYPLLIRDSTRVYRIGAFIDEVGLESLSIGMTENLTSPVTEPGSEEEYNTAGTTAYEVHASRAVEFDRVRDAWVHDVASYRPAVNTGAVHLLSNGISLATASFRITVSSCNLGFPQYRGGGGNGYLFHVQGSDMLLRDSRAERARHGFIINNASSGTVFLRDTTVNSRYSDDSHRFLAHANLYDNFQLDRAWLQSVNRGTTSTGAGFTGTQHVFWNTHVAANHASARGCAIESAQWGHGYLLGSTAAPGATALLCPTSYSNSTWARLDQGAPTDFTEAAGTALYPPSLYEAQRALRCAREGLVCR